MTLIPTNYRKGAVLLYATRKGRDVFFSGLHTEDHLNRQVTPFLHSPCALGFTGCTQSLSTGRLAIEACETNCSHSSFYYTSLSQ